MAECRLLLMAENVTRDEVKGITTVFNLVENLRYLGLPALILSGHFSVYASFDREEHDTEKLDCSLKLANGPKVLVNDNFPAHFKNAQQALLIVNINGVPVSEPDDLKLTLTYGGAGGGSMKTKILTIPLVRVPVSQQVTDAPQ